MEYDYAVGAGLPTLAFLHKDPGTIPANKTDPTDEGKAALVAFRAKNERARHAKYWISSAELAGTVTLGMASLMKIKPRVGWVRADLVPDGEGRKDELLRLRREIDSLNGELAVASNRAAPEGVDDLAQGSDTTNITVEFESPGIFSLDVRWDSLMRAVLPQTFGGGAPPEAVGAAVASLVQREGLEMRLAGAEQPGGSAPSFPEAITARCLIKWWRWAWSRRTATPPTCWLPGGLRRPTGFNWDPACWRSGARIGERLEETRKACELAREGSS